MPDGQTILDVDLINQFAWKFLQQIWGIKMFEKLFDLLEGFSWEKEFTKEKFSKEAKDNSWNFLYDFDVPRTKIGNSPKDLLLFNLCVSFHHLVQRDEVELAKKKYEEINDRVKYIQKNNLTKSN